MRQVETLGDGLGGEAVARLVERLRRGPGAGGTAKVPTPGPIMVACSCGRNYKVKASLAGKKIKCAHCHAVVRVPGAPPPGEDRTLPPVPVISPTQAAGGLQAEAAGKDQHLWDFLAPRQAPDEIGRLGDYHSYLLQSLSVRVPPDVVVVKEPRKLTGDDRPNLAQPNQ
jgi:hypothetical protein